MGLGLADGKAAFLLAAQEVLEGIFPGVLVVRGESLACARSSDERDDRAEPGGYEEDVAVSVRVRTTLLESVLGTGGALAKDEQVSLDGRAMRVGACGLEAGDVAWWVELVER